MVVDIQCKDAQRQVTGRSGKGSPVSGMLEYTSESSLLKRKVPPIKVLS